MKSIQKFQADDGTEFDCPISALAHDELCAEIKSIRELLPLSPPSGANECVQHDPQIFLQYQRRLVRLFMETVPYLADNPHILWALYAEYSAGNTLIGRYMNDAGPAPLYSAWYRVMCTDRQFREWGQPYFAIQSDRWSR